MRTRKIALLGLGTVGQGLWQLLNINKLEIQRRLGAEISVSHILVRNTGKPRAVDVPATLLTTDFNDILAAPEVEVVVEMMGGMEPANSYIRQALQSGKHVVTANKALMAQHGSHLTALAAQAGVSLRYEAAVCGAIPIINVLQTSLAAERVTSLVGILNGTSNYILSQMAEQGISYAEALIQAQQLGYAETDPTLDVQGLDAQHKLRILTRLAYHVDVPASAIYCRGITHIKPEDMAYAHKQGLRIKLLAVAQRQEDRLELWVAPVMLSADHVLAKVSGVGNAILVQGEGAGRLLFTGLGAGGLPTGSAILSDILAVLCQSEQKSEYGPDEDKPISPKLLDVGHQPADWYLRWQWPGSAPPGEQLLSYLKQQGVTAEAPLFSRFDRQNTLQMHITGATRGQLEQASAKVATAFNIQMQHQLLRIVSWY